MPWVGKLLPQPGKSLLPSRFLPSAPPLLASLRGMPGGAVRAVPCWIPQQPVRVLLMDESRASWIPVAPGLHSPSDLWHAWLLLVSALLEVSAGLRPHLHDLIYLPALKWTSYTFCLLILRRGVNIMNLKCLAQ